MDFWEIYDLHHGPVKTRCCQLPAVSQTPESEEPVGETSDTNFRRNPINI